MKISTRLAPLAFLVPFNFAQAACEPRVDAVELPQPAPPITRSQVRVLVVSPSEGTPLRADSVLGIDLEYRISDFVKGDYLLAALFKSGTYRSKSIDYDGKDSSVRLDYPVGKVTICLPMAQIYGEDAESVVWPLELSVALLKADGRGGSTGDTLSKTIKLNTVDIPAAALARQAKAPPPEYDDALEFTFNHFLRSEGLYKVCLRHFPAMQTKLTPAYRTWEARHKADIDYISGLKFEAFKEQTGRADVAMSIIDQITEAQQKGLESLSTGQLQGSCDEVLEQMNPQDDQTDDIIGSYLGVLRKWKAKP